MYHPHRQSTKDSERDDESIMKLDIADLNEYVMRTASRDKPERTKRVDHQNHNYRFMQFSLVFLLNFLSDLNCYSLCPLRYNIRNEYNEKFANGYSDGIPNVSMLVTFWLLFSIPTILAYHALHNAFGQRKVLLLGATLLALGAIVRTNLSFYAGYALMGLSQPLYQISAITHSSEWHGPEERVMVTCFLLGADQLGLGFAYLIGSFVNSDKMLFYYIHILSLFTFSVFVLAVSGGIREYNDGVDVIPEKVKDDSTVATVPTAKNDDDTSRYQEMIDNEKIHAEEDEETDYGDDEEMQMDFGLYEAFELFGFRGFTHALIAFSIASCVVDVLSVNMNLILVSNSFSDTASSWVGFFFQVFILVSSWKIGESVDKTKDHYGTVKWMVGFSSAVLMLFAFEMSEEAHAVGILKKVWMSLLVFLLGVGFGPLGAVSAEMGAYLTYPVPVCLVLQVMLMCGNICGAVLIPIFEAISKNDGEAGRDYALYFVAGICLVVLISFQISSFNRLAKLNRQHEAYQKWLETKEQEGRNTSRPKTCPQIIYDRKRKIHIVVD